MLITEINNGFIHSISKKKLENVEKNVYLMVPNGCDNSSSIGERIKLT